MERSIKIFKERNGREWWCGLEYEPAQECCNLWILIRSVSYANDSAVNKSADDEGVSIIICYIPGDRVLREE